MNIKNFDIEERAKQAVNNFESGFNCSQAIFLAYSDVLDVDIEMASKISVSFGGGIGKMREVCGTISAMAILAGFKYVVLDPNDLKARTKNYAIVQKMTDLFKEKHDNIVCRSLLQKSNIEVDTNPELTKRTNEFYNKRPCKKFVEDAARIAGRMLKGEFEELLF